MEEEFRFPRSFKSLWLFCVVVFSGIVLIVLVLAIIDSSQGWKLWLITGLCLALFIPATIYSFYVLRMGDDYVRVDSSGITYVPRRGKPVGLPWSDIHNIKERNYLQRLELYNARGRKVMNLEFQMEGFARLRQLILESAGHLKEKMSRVKVFRKAFFAHGMLIFAILLFAGMGWLAGRQGEYWVQWIFGGLAVWSVVAFAKLLWKVRVDYHHVSLVYPFWGRKVKYSEIGAIKLENVSDRGNEIITVFVELKNGKRLEFAHFKEGAIPLYESLRAAWERVAL